MICLSRSLCDDAIDTSWAKASYVVWLFTTWSIVNSIFVTKAIQLKTDNRDVNLSMPWTPAFISVVSCNMWWCSQKFELNGQGMIHDIVFRLAAMHLPSELVWSISLPTWWAGDKCTQTTERNATSVWHHLTWASSNTICLLRLDHIFHERRPPVQMALDRSVAVMSPIDYDDILI